MAKPASEIWRKYVTPDVPASGVNQPSKDDIREWAVNIEQMASASGAAAVFETKDLLDASLDYAANSMAWVVDDPTPANNGIYQKSGESGTGSWTKLAPLPAPLDSPAFTGTPTAPTPASADDSTRIATTEHVKDYAAPIVSPTFTGTPTAPTPASADDSTRIATTEHVKDYAAPIVSPTFTGTPTAPTPAPGDDSTKLATTGFVAASFAPIASPTFTGEPKAPTPASEDNSTKLATTEHVKAFAAPKTDFEALRDTDKVADGAVSGPAILLADADDRAVISADVRMPIHLEGDRVPDDPRWRLVIGVGTSIMAGGNTVAASPFVPQFGRPLRPRRFWMCEAAGLNGLASTTFASLGKFRVVPAHEGVMNPANTVLGQSFATTMMLQWLDYEDRYRRATAKRVWFNSGRGGGNYPQNLKKNAASETAPYDNVLAFVQAMVDEFGASNVVVEAIVADMWTNETEGGSDAASIQGKAEEFYDDLNTDLKAITGQSAAIPMFYVCESIKYTDGRGAGAQDAMAALDAVSRSDPNNRQIYLAATRFNVKHGDNLHPMGPGRAQIGMELGQFIAEYFHGTADPPVKVTGATIDGNDIVVATDALYPLAIDTDNVPDASSVSAKSVYGVVVHNGSAVAQDISAISVDGTTIRITMASTPAAGWKVRLGRDNIASTAFGPGGWHNFRDTRTTTFCYDGVTPLYRWVIPSETTVTT